MQIRPYPPIRELAINVYTWAEIDTLPLLTDKERRELYAYLVKEAHIPGFRVEMRQWLGKLDNKRKDFYTCSGARESQPRSRTGT